MSLDPKRLRRLVKQRERLEHVQEGVLAAATRLHTERARALDAVRAERFALFDEGLASAGAVDPEALASASAYIVRLERDIEMRRAALAHSAAQVEAERLRLLERRRDRKAMEFLLDRQLAEHRRLQLRATGIVLDELASNRWLASQT